MNNDTAPIRINLKTTITHPGQAPEKLEMWVDGSFKQKDEKIYIQYDEVQDGKKMRTTLRFGHQDGIIMRNGDIKMRMPFHIEADLRGHYEADFGQMPIIIRTHKLINNLPTTQRREGEIFVTYELLIDGHSAGKYELEFLYTEGK